MDYAMIENGVVVNLIVLLPQNAHEFPGAVPLEGAAVKIGDRYENGAFVQLPPELPPEETKLEGE